jgi:plastocyanin
LFTRPLVALAMLAPIAMTACGQGAPDATCEPHGTELEIAVLASLSHHFTKDCLAAPAGQPFTIYFNNQDTSPHGNHNIHIVLPDEDFVGERAFHGTDITYEVAPLPAGTYEFHCDEHLAMKGTFVVGRASTAPSAATT